MSLLSDLRKALYYCQRNGLAETCFAVAERLSERRAAETRRPYVYETPSESVLEAQRMRAGNPRPRISIVVPAYETPKEFLYAMLQSVAAQTCPDWELLLMDGSESDTVEENTKAFLALQTEENRQKIKYHRIPNEGIAENTNRGIRLAEGEYVAFLDHDDLLTPDSIYKITEGIDAAKKTGVLVKLLYSDEDKCDKTGRKFSEPHKKQNFNLDLLLSNNYICHLMAVETALAKELRLRSEFDGAQDYDFALRVVERILFPAKKTLPNAEIKNSPADDEKQIVHIPRVLYHWRNHATSTAQNPQSKLYAYEAGRRAADAFIRRRGWRAHAEDTVHLGFYRVAYDADIFSVRKDVAMVGGAVFDKRGRTVGGIYEGGRLIFAGLPKKFSGTLHRASLMQDAETLDVRCFRLRPELREEFATFCEGETTGAGDGAHKRIAGKENMPDMPDKKTSDEKHLPTETRVEQIERKGGALSLPCAQETFARFCALLREKGWRLLYDPTMCDENNGHYSEL